MKKNIMIVIGIILFIAIILGLAKYFIESGVNDIEKSGYGAIQLPNGYSIVKIHAQNGNVIHSPIMNQTSVETNIVEVGNDGKIVAYKREFGTNKEFGFIDTTNKDDKYKPELVTESEFNNRIKQLNIVVEPVSKLFPETKCGNSQKIKSFEEKEILNKPFSITSVMSVVISKNYINQKYGNPEIERQDYEIRTLSDGSKLFVSYQGDSVRDIWRLKKLFSKTEFSEIEIGKSTVTDVQKIDPYFNLFKEGEIKAISEHRLNDNGLITISYSKENDVWVVAEVEYQENDPSGFSVRLLPEDKNSLLIEGDK